MSLPQAIKTWWPVVLAGAFVMTVMSGGIGYYARAEAEKIIEVKMRAPLKRIEDYSRENRKTLNELRANQRENSGRYDERLNAIDRSLNIIIQNQRRR